MYLFCSKGNSGLAGKIGGPGILHGKTGEMIGRWTQSGLLAKYLNEPAGKIIANGNQIAKEEISDILEKVGLKSIAYTIGGNATGAFINDVFAGNEVKAHAANDNPKMIA